MADFGISETMLLTAAVGASVVGTAASAFEARESGIAQSKEYRAKARIEQDSERAKQITMRQNMLRALASQNAGSLGAVGTGRGTSFGANVGRQLSQGQNDLMISRSNSSAQVSLLDAAATNASQAGSIAMAGDLVGGAGSAISGYETLKAAMAKPPGT